MLPSAPPSLSSLPLRKSKDTTQEVTQTYINETYGWAEPKASSGEDGVGNVVTMESGEVGPGYAAVSSPSHAEGQQENECYHNYETLQHVTH